MPSRCSAHVVLALLIGGAWLYAPAAPARAQTTDSTAVRVFKLAQAYLQAGQYAQALPLLEDLHASHPDRHLFYDRLKTAYENLKRYDEAIALVEQRMRRAPGPAVLAEEARLLHLRGDGAAASRTWQAALALAPEKERTYRVVYQSLIDARRFDLAIAAMHEGRAALADSALFRLEMAYLYNLTGRHADALREYLRLLDQNENRLNFVQRRLSPFLEQEGAIDSSLAVMRRVIETPPPRRTHHALAAWLYMEAGQYAEALDAYRTLDRMAEGKGRLLLSFAHAAADAGAYESAATAFKEILERHGQTPVAPQARYGLGRLHARWAEASAADPTAEADTSAAHYAQALDAYQLFLETYPAHEAFPEVLRRVGDLQLHVFHRLDAAEKTLERVVSRYPETPAADEAAFDLGRIGVLRGDLDAAEQTFARLLERLAPGELAGRVHYQQALLHFYRGAFDEALALAAAINQDLAADVANDAIALSVLIQTGSGPDSTNTPLRRFAEARLLHRQQRFSEALAVLDALLAAHGRHALADEARFLRARMHRAQGRLEEALAAFGEIPLMHPESPLADRSLLARARLQERKGALKAAVETYNRLLDIYPGSLLADEVRTRLRALWQNDD